MSSRFRTRGLPSSLCYAPEFLRDWGSSGSFWRPRKLVSGEEADLNYRRVFTGAVANELTSTCFLLFRRLCHIRQHAKQILAMMDNSDMELLSDSEYGFDVMAAMIRSSIAFKLKRFLSEELTKWKVTWYVYRMQKQVCLRRRTPAAPSPCWLARRRVRISRRTWVSSTYHFRPLKERMII